MGICSITTSMDAQKYERTAKNIKDNPTKKGPNLSVNLPFYTRNGNTTHFNLGLMSNIYRLEGCGLNLLSGTVRNDMNGLQISGLTNITQNNAVGLQISGISNIAGDNSYGCMLSGLMNISNDMFSGVQIAGISNITGDNTRGVNLAGIMNLTSGNVYGLQLAAVGNVGVRVKGLQLAGISNNAIQNLTGMQLCGAANIAVKADKALQLSGITNICQGEFKGVQLAPGNYAGSVRGVQIGLLNLCTGKVEGVQIGVINHSKDSTAHKVGLVNITPSTRIQLLFYGGNMSKTNVAVRFKNRFTYTAMGFGTHYLDLNDKFSGCLFYRAGFFHQLLPKLELSGDFGYFHIENFENEDATTPERMYSLQGRVNIEYRLRKKLHLFASTGYSITRYYNRNKVYEKKPIFEAGVILF